MLFLEIKPNSIEQIVNIFWFRRDLRLQDNAGLYHALRSPYPVIPIFIFDRNILDKIEHKSDRRVEFIYISLLEIQNQLIQIGSSLETYYGFPEEIYQLLLNKYRIDSVFVNSDYEPYARERDETVRKILKESGASLHNFKDQVIFEQGEILKDDQTPYTIFTPYSKRWKDLLNKFYLKSYPTNKYFHNFYKQAAVSLLLPESFGFTRIATDFPVKNPPKEIFEKYDQQRDIPGIEGTSRLSIHLRFGTISIRKLAAMAWQVNEIFLNELIWRDFYQMILWHFPQLGRGKSFKPEYDFIQWRNNELEFEKWCNGMTGYPIVDAGMRQLNETGYMHNRLRMITASFLTKHLLIDWRWGEAYFAEKLLDFDLASNNGGWQWSAGSGCDAAPYFRIFNPHIQTKKFDPDLTYIRKWVPELEDLNYPQPIVDHEFARRRALSVYASALKKIIN